MIVWHTRETSCPMCRQRLRIRTVGGGFAIGQDSDLLVRMEGKHVIQAEIHSCHNCKFSGDAFDFTERRVTTAMVDRFFAEVVDELEGDKPRSIRERQAASQTPLPHLQHEWSGLAGAALGIPSVELGDRYLRAYWCLRLSPSKELPAEEKQALAKRYLRESIAKYRHGLRNEPRRDVVYIVGELCRRNENFALAAQYFTRYLEREPGPRYLKLAADRLRTLAAAGDSAHRTMESLLYDEPEPEERGRNKNLGHDRSQPSPSSRPSDEADSE